MRQAALVLALFAAPAAASDINPLDLGKLAEHAPLVVIGFVRAIPDTDESSDTVTVQVVSVMKGQTTAKEFTLRLRNKGVKDFDPVLPLNAQGVFFLKGIENGKAELAYWGSVAVFPKQTFKTPQ